MAHVRNPDRSRAYQLVEAMLAEGSRVGAAAGR
jgi:hypothetical protein